MKLNGASITLGGMAIGFTCDDYPNLTLDNTFMPFLTNEEPDMLFRIYSAADRELSTISIDKEVLRHGPWRIYEDETKKKTLWVFESTRCSSCLSILSNANAKTVDIFISDIETYHECSLKHLIRPRFLSFLLLPRHGLVIHACAIRYEAQGWLFIGRSGAGKSTISALWKDQHDALPLSDETVVIRRIGNEFFVYGTPWCSSAGIVSAKHAKLWKVFFIYHEQENVVLEKKRMEAVTSLLSQTFLPMWLPSQVNNSIRLLKEIAVSTPCYDLGFVPNGSILEFMRCNAKD